MSAPAPVAQEIDMGRGDPLGDRIESALEGAHLDRMVDRVQAPVAALVARLAPGASVLLSTADGFPLWSDGLSEWQVDQVTAMGSALHAVLGSVSQALRDPARPPSSGPPMVVMSQDDVTTVVLAIETRAAPGALLWLTGSDSPGTLIAHGRTTVAAIGRAVDAVPS